MNPDATRYHLPALDRQGIIFGLTIPQLIVVSIGFTATMIFLTMTSAGIFIAIAPCLIATAIIKFSIGGIPALELIGPIFSGISKSKKREWTAKTVWNGTEGDTPKALSGVTVTDEHWHGLERMAVVWDETAKSAALVLHVPGVDFALRTPAEQQALLTGWGVALSGFAVEGSPIERICVSQTANRSSLNDHETWVKNQGSGITAELRTDYNNLVAAAGPSTTTHNTHVTVVVSSFRFSRSSWGSDGKSEHERLLDALRRSTHQLLASLGSAELKDTKVLDTTELATVMQHACDPTTAQAVAPRSGSLADRLGATGNDRMGPTQSYYHANWYETDYCGHRTFWIQNWPRHPLHASWLTNMLSQPDTARRFIVIFRPVKPSVSHKRIDRELTRIHGDTEHKIEAGGRISAETRRHLAAVEEREEELVSGFAEVTYLGLVTVSGDSIEALEQATASFESSALQAGLTLRPLDHQQDTAWAAALPLGLGVDLGRTADF